MKSNSFAETKIQSNSKKTPLLRITVLKLGFYFLMLLKVLLPFNYVLIGL